MLPTDWQDTIASTRARVEDHWKTPSIGAIARFITEEAGELLAMLNRLANPELLRSTPLQDKDKPARELGQTLCMAGSLGNALGIHILPATPRPSHTETSTIAASALNLMAADLSHTVTVWEHSGDPKELLTIKIGHSLDKLVGQVIATGDLLGIDPYDGMMDFFVHLEAKVEAKRKEATRNAKPL